MKDMETF